MIFVCGLLEIQANDRTFPFHNAPNSPLTHHKSHFAASRTTTVVFRSPHQLIGTYQLSTRFDIIEPLLSPTRAEPFGMHPAPRSPEGTRTNENQS
jgi:hypothetical protein